MAKGQRITEEFKKTIVSLYNNGKDIVSICKEYSLAKSTVYQWVKLSTNGQSFKKTENLTENEKELIQLRKENKQLAMELDILKQAALIMAKR